MDLGKIKQAQKEFQDKMADLKKRQSNILTSISEDLDQQKLNILLKKVEKIDDTRADNN